MSTMDIMDTLTFPDVAEVLGVAITRVHQYVRDGQLVAIAPGHGPRVIPALCLQNGEVVKSLPAVVTLLRDAGFTDDDIVAWLWREDDTLPGSPIEALRADRGTEIKRRAQAAGF